MADNKLIELDPKLKILIVSNDNDVRFSTSKLLKTSGFQNLTETPNGVQALNECTKTKFDVVICDQLIKFIPGAQFIKEFKTHEEVRNSPLIYVGANECDVEKAELEEYGVLGYLKHPFELKNLMDLLVKTYAMCEDENSLESKYSKAKEALINNKSDDAVSAYSELQQMTEKANRSSIGLAQAYVQKKDTEKVKETLKDITDENSLQALILKFKVSLSESDDKSAMEAKDKIFALAGDNPFYYIRMKDVALSVKNGEIAESICDSAIKKEFDLEDFFIGKAKARYILGSIEDSLKDLARSEKKFGLSLSLLNLRGICLRKQEKFEKAASCYEESLKIDPRNAVVFFNLGICKQAMNDKDGAIECLETSLKFSPTFSKAKMKLDEIRGKKAS